MTTRSDPGTWTDPRHRLGLDGEELAMDFLARTGWKIRAHRFRMGRLEIDIVAEQSRTVAFIEVKTRKGERFGRPEEAVTWHKQQEIARVAQAWMDRYGRWENSYRFDVIAITILPGRSAEVRHITDAFRPGWR